MGRNCPGAEASGLTYEARTFDELPGKELHAGANDCGDLVACAALKRLEGNAYDLGNKLRVWRMRGIIRLSELASIRKRVILVIRFCLCYGRQE